MCGSTAKNYYTHPKGRSWQNSKRAVSKIDPLLRGVYRRTQNKTMCIGQGPQRLTCLQVLSAEALVGMAVYGDRSLSAADLSHSVA